MRILNNGISMGSLAVGAGVVLLAPVVIPVIGSILKPVAKGLRKNKFTFYASRLQAIFVRSYDCKILKIACYSCGFAVVRSNKSDPNPGA